LIRAGEDNERSICYHVTNSLVLMP